MEGSKPKAAAPASAAAAPAPAADPDSDASPAASDPAPGLPPEQRLYFPDGTYLPVLNGAVGADPVRWQSERPYSPVVRTVRGPKGLDWYVHADGTRSTTHLIWRADLGRYDAVTRMAYPLPALQVPATTRAVAPRRAPRQGAPK